MAVTLGNKYVAQPADTDTTLYTAPAGTIARVVKCTATNDTTTAVTITFHKVPTGETLGDENLILNAKDLGSKETYECPEVVGQVLDAADLISAVASVADQVTVSLDVAEIT